MGWGTWQGEELKLFPVLYRGRHSSGTDTHLTAQPGIAAGTSVLRASRFCLQHLLAYSRETFLSEYGRKESIPKLVNHFTV